MSYPATDPPRPEPDGEIGLTWILFRPLASDIPSAVRMRSLLKAALRQWKMKAERITAVGPDGVDTRDASTH